MPSLKTRLTDAEEKLAQPEYYNSPLKSKVLLKDKKQLEFKLNEFGVVKGLLDDAFAMIELGEEGDDDAMADELILHLDRLEAALGEQEVKHMLSGENDPNNAILSINSGAGGTESQDWSEILLRMYLRYAERKGYKTQIVDILAGEEAGIKNVTLTISGPYAYGYFKAEAGVHRLVRISPFDANKRRHTSFASVFATPEVDDAIDIQIEEKDLRIDTYRAGGCGGQHVNKTDSAVRLTHLPTNIVVACQNERSQVQNKNLAMKLLRSKLYELELQKRKEEMKDIEAGKRDISFGNQIRSYVLQPYQLVKDHRTGHETSNVNAVLDGDLEPFVKDYLLSQHGGAS